MQNKNLALQKQKVVEKTWTDLTGQTRVSGLQAKPGFGFLGLGFAFSKHIPHFNSEVISLCLGKKYLIVKLLL